MLDVSYFQNSTSNVQLFQNGDTWQTWVKPRGAKTVNFFVVGAGSGGGGGFLAATGAKGGGAGGGNGGYVKLTLPAGSFESFANISLVPNFVRFNGFLRFKKYGMIYPPSSSFERIVAKKSQ